MTNEIPPVAMVDQIDERAHAMEALARVLAPANENVKRGYLVASINDLAQAKLTNQELYQELYDRLTRIVLEMEMSASRLMASPNVPSQATGAVLRYWSLELRKLL